MINSVSNAGIVIPDNPFAEVYIPLMMGLGSMSSSTGTLSHPNLLQKMAGAATGSISDSTRMFRMNEDWSADQKFCLEAHMRVTSGPAAANLCLWDLTANVQVAASLIVSAAGALSAVQVRSSSFTLTPGNIYGLSLIPTGSSSFAAYATRINLIALMK